jgi:16S rRNA (cytosine967-C5)-methyltransferase
VPWDALVEAGDLGDALAAVLAGVPAERVLDRALRDRRGVSAQARQAVAEAVFGVGLWRRRLRHAIGDPAASPALLLAALLRDLAARPAAEAEALARLAPGTLPPPRAPPSDLATRASLPDWLAAELVRAAGPEADALADALGVPGPVCLRVNALRTGVAALAARLGAEGVPVREGRLAPGCLVAEAPRVNVLGLAAHREGLLEVQDEGSQLLGLALGAADGETVLDLCAGAGGKTLQLAAAVGPRGRVHAADPDGARLSRLRARAARAGAGGIVEVHGAAPPPALRVDRVLVDAPCSELGPLRRGPDLRWRIDPAGFGALPALQCELLARGAAHVRPGGRLVYATCTFRSEENAEAAEAFEREHDAFRRVAALPEGAVSAAAAAAVVGADGFLRTWPHRHGTDGFFAAAWVRAR